LAQDGPGGANVAAGFTARHPSCNPTPGLPSGKLPLARHRMVYATLGELMGGAIHALSLRTLTPEEAARGS